MNYLLCPQIRKYRLRPFWQPSLEEGLNIVTLPGDNGI